MKILYLHQYFKLPTQNGGTRSFDLATNFVKNGLDVEIITSTNDIKLKNRKRWTLIEIEGVIINMMYLPFDNNMSFWERVVSFFKFSWFASFKIINTKCDIVLATSTPLTIGIPVLLKKWVNNTPFVFEVRDVWPEVVIAIGAIKNKIIQFFLYKLEQIIYNNAKAIVPLSRDMKFSIVTRYPRLCLKPIIVIENIAETHRFQECIDKNKSLIINMIGFVPRFLILYAGTFGKVNGLSYVVELASKLYLIDPTIIFMLIGEGAEKDVLVKLSKERNVLHKNIYFFDSVSKQELPQLYFECSMGSSFVLNIKELWANSANKFFDTLASGRPVLINHRGWQKEEIDKECLGYVLPEIISDEAIFDFVNYTYNIELQIIQQYNAINISSKNYSLDVATKKYLRLFNRVLQ